MRKLCEGRVVIVTGAGRGIGRGEAIEFARQGAKVVVNDLGTQSDGEGNSIGPAQDVVNEILAFGGQAIANGDDVSEWDGAKRIIDAAIGTFGGLDVLVNNAGILRDRMLVNMTLEEWDAVIKVHLRGTFCTSRIAASYWRARSKDGHANNAAIINTTSVSGLFGTNGQTNYAAAKAGIASLTINAANELARYGVTVNAISPGARTRMTENLASTQASAPPPDAAFDPRDPDNVAPIVVWLGSTEAQHVTGRVFESNRGQLCLYENWRRGPRVKQDTRFDPAALRPVVDDLIAGAAAPESLLPVE